MLGRWGESLAADYLRKKGYQLLAAGWRCRFGEIDLIASDDTYLCFVEVKLRKSDAFGKAEEFVDFRKREKLHRSAQLYLMQNPTCLQPRFDVIAIDAHQGINTRTPALRHLENAF